MDTFFEQIIAVKKNGKALAAIIGIWLAAFLVCFVLIMFMGVLGTFSLLLAAGALFGAYKLSVRFNVEYEYIVTNGTMDIDKIINKNILLKEFENSITYTIAISKDEVKNTLKLLENYIINLEILDDNYIN